MKSFLAFGIWFFAAVVMAQTPSAVSVLKPNDNLHVEGIPSVPLSLTEDVLRYNEFRGAGFVGWHPTERKMLISTRFADVAQLHEVSFPLGARKQLTFFKERVGGNYEPIDGNYLLLSKDVGGNENAQFYRYSHLNDAATVLLTDGKSQNGGAVWSTKKDRMAYGSTRRNGKDRDFYMMNPLDPKTDKLIFQNEGGGWGVVDWSPDDTKLLVRQGISANESYLWLFDLATNARTLLTPKSTGDPIAYSGIQFSKDGTKIYLVSDKDAEFQQLGVMDMASKQLTFLTGALKWDVENVDITDDEQYAAFVTNENGASVLHVLDLTTKQEAALPKLPLGVIGNMAWHKKRPELAFTFTSARFPNDVYSINLDTEELIRWTESESGGLNTAQFSEPQLVKWKSFDGLEISGFLYMPPAQKFKGKRPVIIDIHGGPEGQSRPVFLGSDNYYLNELGVAILFPNIRGSSGYGKTYLKLDNGFKRMDSYKDIAALCDWVKSQPNLDASRILVMGGSYGGITTLAVATFFSEKIRCALSVVGASNLVTFLENTADYRRDLRRVEYGDERDPKMREYLNSIAPLNYIEKIKKPLFVVQGANDPRVPASEAEQIIKAMQAKNIPVWYLLGKDEGHGFAKKKNRDFQFYSTILFVKEYLLK
jgi:dipeptidyl aminopeptidase/acylaminoacyl peptidase